MKILFLCGDNSSLGPMAEGFLRAGGAALAEVGSAGVRSGTLVPGAVEAMKEAGIDISTHVPRGVADLGSTAFDLIITLSPEARSYARESSCRADETAGGPPEKCALFVGVPVRMHWTLPEPPGADAGPGAWRSLRDRIGEWVQRLVDLDFLAALDKQRQQRELLLDAMEDGIIVHDENRNIFLFNRAAERITGYRREEVLGRNCHEVFAPDGLCGSHCRLLEEDPERKESCTYEQTFTDRKGVDRRLHVVSGPTELEKGGPRGILATFRDVTEVSELRWKMNKKYSFHGMVGQSAAMREVFDIIRQVTSSDYPVLISGESGTGKELVARAIHNESRRKRGPFVPINCGALPETILESELFGHVRGAFTGAIRDKKGRFELAHKGTLFLDEVGELSPAFQVKLLRVLEQKLFEPVGGERSINVDVRVISATNRDLREMTRDGRFRDDLFYRLSVVPIHLPPLRERRDDLALLVEQILDGIRKDTGRAIQAVGDDTMDLLLRYRWPGNIRELINALQFASVRSASGKIEQANLPPEIRSNEQDGGSHGGRAAAERLPARRRKLDRESVERALAETGGNKVKAARVLGVGRATLYRFLGRNPVS